ncbi:MULTISPECIES: Asp23/Gls24 family envelope stress response protein [Streptomycetaceae]|jgi:uncharacterized alkaline shock family protein YloU|uniref:Asp23/Gls24 family envelope stress response protein n=1 Tax=Streptomycetaceae TaxID=2062 RepID=UPI00300B919F
MTTAENSAKTGPGRHKETAGRTTIADSVVATIAGIATREVEGVHAMGGGATRAVGAVRDRVARSDAHTRGVKVEVGEEQAAIDLDVVVLYGTHIAETASDIRGSVTSAVELMTGLEVVEVNVNVRDVHVPGEESDEEEESPGRVR